MNISYATRCAPISVLRTLILPYPPLSKAPVHNQQPLFGSSVTFASRR